MAFFIVTSIPGYGQSQPVEDYSMDGLAIHFKDLIKRLDIDPCMVVGHSLGGYIALALAENFPDLLSGLCLFHSSAFADTDEKKENRNKGIEFIERNNVKSFVEPFFGPLFSPSNKEKFKDTINNLINKAVETPAHVIQNTLAGMRDRPDRIHVLRQVDFPVLFIIGKDDGAVPLEKSLEQCSVPDKSWAVFLNQTGHMGMFECKDETLFALKSFASWVGES